jgi:ornithine cyclodeaminase/alanine dehydrogenase-like protein (mu-crystallin family)
LSVFAKNGRDRLPSLTAAGDPPIIPRMRLIDRATVLELLDPTELIEAIAVAMADLSTGRAAMPPRIAASAGQAGLLATMPAYSPSLDVLAAKLLTIYPNNASAGHPVHQALILTFAPTTGQPTALMDGDAITALRTAAGSALSARLLARPDAQILAVLGTGPQAHAHVRLTALVRPFREIRLAGRDPAKVTHLAHDLATHGLDVRPCTIDTALDGADVICTATSTIKPIIRAGQIRAGAHIASVGYIPHGRELDPDLYTDALLAVEHRPTALQPFPVGSNDIIEAVEHGTVNPGNIVELGELVDGHHPGRTDDRQLTIYKSVGVAIQDAAAAALVLSAAQRANTGKSITI